MHRTPLHRLHFLVLAAFLGLGLSLSAVQAGIMSVQMGIAAMLPESGPGECADCEGGDALVDVGLCLSVCGAAAHALLPGEPETPLPVRSVRLRPVDLPSVGHGATPDPGPPRALVLG
jgi:hypothetical protein